MTLLDKIHDDPLCVRDMADSDRAKAAEILGDLAGGTFPADFLPVTGVAVEHFGKAVCYLPIYLESTSSVAVLGHFISVPGADKFLLDKAAELAINSAKIFAKKHGKRFALSVFGCRSVNRIADRLGFVTTENIEEKIFNLE